MMSPQIVRALVLAGATLVGAAALVVARRMGLIDPDTALRATMALLGLVMVIYANDIPKAVIKKTPRGQAMQRLTARVLVLAYLAYVAVWLFAPMSIANGAALIPIGLALAWIVGACLLSRRSSAATPPA